ncbi:MAG TPA: hypothetical protein DCQ06_00415 [Myxococcales bacterium]|nr:hypothetical protein [Myxococcales bacterium]HAN30034.1 hypothetical protein [Myxococcales bacterium]
MFALCVTHDPKKRGEVATTRSSNDKHRSANNGFVVLIYAIFSGCSTDGEHFIVGHCDRQGVYSGLRSVGSLRDDEGSL